MYILRPLAAVGHTFCPPSATALFRHDVDNIYLQITQTTMPLSYVFAFLKNHRKPSHNIFVVQKSNISLYDGNERWRTCGKRINGTTVTNENKTNIIVIYASGGIWGNDGKQIRYFTTSLLAVSWTTFIHIFLTVFNKVIYSYRMRKWLWDIPIKIQKESR